MTDGETQRQRSAEQSSGGDDRTHKSPDAFSRPRGISEGIRDAILSVFDAIKKGAAAYNEAMTVQVETIENLKRLPGESEEDLAVRKFLAYQNLLGTHNQF